MAEITGRSGVSAYFDDIIKKLPRLLENAARAGGRVIRDEAKARSDSHIVADAIVVKVKEVGDGRVQVVVTVKPGGAYSLGIWQEYGTSPHFISVGDEQRGGLGLRKINARVREAGGDASLVIGGKFVGPTVLHPGARANPFLRPAFDTKQTEAVKAAQNYINSKVSRRGIGGGDEGDEA